MWIQSTVGAFSIVQKPWDAARDTLTIRSRVRQDLDGLRTIYLPDLGPTQYDANADYHYRAVAPRASVMAAMSALMGDVTYPDFKSEILRVQGPERAHIYGAVWSVLRRLQKPQVPPDIPVMFASIGDRADVFDDDDDRPLSHDPTKGPG